MRPVKANAEVQTIHPCLVAYQRVIRIRLLVRHCPDLDGLVEGSRGKHRGVFGVDGDLHDVVFVVLVRVDLLKVFVPVEEFNGLVIGTREDVGQLGMDGKVPDEVGVVVDDFEFLGSVVVVHPDLGIVCPHNNPLLPRHKLRAPNWRISHLKGPNLSLLIVVVYCNVASVQCYQNPGKRGVKLHTFDTL